jgi:hypothetical protein
VAKHCTNCGHGLRDTDKFCPECGTSVNQESGTNAGATYETCEIKWKRQRSMFLYRFVFYAEAIGPRGMYAAAQSAEVVNSPSPAGMSGVIPKRTHAALNALVSLLAAEGWEPVSEKGPAWYSYKFRRPVRR